MKKLVLFLLLYFFTTVCYAVPTMPFFEGDDINSLQFQYDELVQTQDSLQNLLNKGRSMFATASSDEKKVISSDIIRFEEELFEVKSQLSQIGSKIAAIQSEMATESLNKMEMQNMSEQSKNLADNAFIKNNLSSKELALLKSYNEHEIQTIATINKIKPLYQKLIKAHNEYQDTRSQRVLDSLLVLSSSITSEIVAFDNNIGQKWLDLYNELLEIYIILLDSAPNTDRSTLESIEVQGRELRREEALKQQNSMTTKLAAFDVQRKYLLSYQKAIAQAASLNLASDALKSTKIVDVNPDFKQIDFLPRILVLYSDVDLTFDYPYSEVDDVPEMILPEKGVYYTVQIALMSKKPEEVAFFKGVGPMQVETISPTKLRYCVAGFNNYEQATEAVAILKKKGLKAPTLVCYLDGEVTTAAIARAKESEEPVVGSYKVVVTSDEAQISETVRQTMEMHASGKSVIRLVKGDGYEFTISEFTSKAEAEVFAQILRTKASNSDIEVLQIEK